MDYDILIIGAGLAGLHCALRLNKPNTKIAIAEAYNYVGGRVVSYNPPDFPNVRWENGAGRIHASHTMIRDYVESYGLHLIKIPTEQTWRPSAKGKQAAVPNPWPSLATILHTMLSQLRPSILARHTVAQLADAAYGGTYTERMLAHFPYRAEVFRMRADLALKSLSEEMKSNDNFFVVKEGLSALMKAMREDLEKKGVTFLLGHRCTGIRQAPSNTLQASFSVREGEKHKHTDLQAKKIILAVHSTALKGISPFSNYPVLKHLKMEPLLRTYGIFPAPHGKPWFHQIHHTVTDSPLRYIIPINPKQGTIMTSYTDAQDTKPYFRLLEKSSKLLEKRIVKDTRELFPELDIPNPLFFKAHPWYDGCTYWLPGLYEPKEESMTIMNPMPHRFQYLYVCGESYSLRQAWMEGALEHAEAMLKKYFL